MVEVVVVVAVLAFVTAIGLAAVQRVRAAADRAACANNARQLATGVHGFAAVRHELPRGCDYAPASPATGGRGAAGLSWHTAILSDIGEAAIWREAVAAFAGDPTGWRQPDAHSRAGRSAPAVLRCPTEPVARESASGFGFTSYQGVVGTGLYRNDGLLVRRGTVRLTDVRDGTSQTVLFGERPPGPGGRYGPWYGNWGNAYCGAAQLLPAGVTARPTRGVGCDPATPPLAPGDPASDCSLGHFWSRHPGGATFAFADGSVRFLPYTAAGLLPALATRAGGEVAALD